MPKVPDFSGMIGKKTKTMCDVCVQTNKSFMVVKQVLGSTTVLACPRCDAIKHERSDAVKKG